MIPFIKGLTAILISAKNMAFPAWWFLPMTVCLPNPPVWKRPATGEQSYDVGYHGGRKESQHGIFPGMGPHFWLDDPMHEECYYTMIKELVTRHRDDERILIWDVYNEPGNSKLGAVTLPKLKHIFEITREINPSQPLTAGVHG